MGVEVKMNADPQYMEAIDNVAVKNEERARGFALTVMLHVKAKQNADTDQCTILDVAIIDDIIKQIMNLAISNNEDDALLSQPSMRSAISSTPLMSCFRDLRLCSVRLCSAQLCPQRVMLASSCASPTKFESF